VIVPVIGPLVALVPVKAAMSPVPLAARPIAAFVFVQFYTIVPPTVGLVNVIAVVSAPLHTV